MTETTATTTRKARAPAEKAEHNGSAHGGTANGGAANGHGNALWAQGPGLAVEQWTQTNAEIVSGTAEIAQEVVSFWQNRFRADVNVWKAFLACRTPGDLFECQRKFVEKTATDYVEEANKLSSRLVQIVGNKAWQPAAKP